MSHIIYTHISVTSMDTIGKKFVGSWIIERSAVVAPAFFFSNFVVRVSHGLETG
jgi:hypothetical protein